MKTFLILVGVVAAAILGYLKEPGFRHQLTGLTPKDDSQKTTKKDEKQTAKLTIDFSALRPGQLPAKVKLIKDIDVASPTPGVSMTIRSGTLVNLVSANEETAIIRLGENPFTITIPISQTDLIEQLITNPPSANAIPEPEADIAPAPIPEPAPEPEIAPDPETTTEPELEPAPVSEEIPEPEIAVEPENTPEPEIAPEEAPEETPQPETAGDESSADGIVAIMQASLNQGQIKEFTADQVVSWTPGPEETIDGEVFETGLVNYNAETIFGAKTIQAKALIQNGKVQRWIWPKSGMEIK
jgi:hypothetical protein